MTDVLPRSPYKGLSPFADTAIDAMLFFGREGDAEIVGANVVASSLTVLYGPSGVGKSSILAAAVARGLRELPEHPVVVVFSAWSESPAAAIAAAVAAEAGVEPTSSLALAVERACAARGDVYLLLDQAEEYFLYHPGGGMLEHELAVVLRSSRVNVLLSLREDALAKLDRFKASIPGILDNYLRLDRLSREAGRAAVVQPLRRWRELGGDPVDVEPALVEAVLDQVAAGRIRSGLGGSGEVEGDGGEERIEAPYLQLVMEKLWEVEQEQGSSTLRAATLERLGGSAQIVAAHLESAMDVLTPAQQKIASELLRQLVTPSGTKIAHGAADLAGYAGVPEAETRDVLESLAARRILRPGDDGSYEIYHDVLAAPILAWRARYEQAQALVAARRRGRRLALVAALAVAGLVIAVFALVQNSRAQSEARRAHAGELDAAAVNLVPTDPELGLLLARNSAVLSPTPGTEEVLQQALGASRLRSVVEVGETLLAAAEIRGNVVAAAENGSVLVSGGGSQRTTETGESAADASIAAAGTVLLTGRDGRLRLVSGGVSRLVPRIGGAVGADVSADATLALVRSGGAAVRLVDLRSGDVRLEVDQGSDATAAAFSVGGRLFATGGADNLVRLWRQSDGKFVRALPVPVGDLGHITAIAFSSRSTLLATASTDGLGRVWDPGTGVPVAVLSGHINYLTDVAFSPDGTQVATASRDRTARTWKADTGAALATFAGAAEEVVSARFTLSGRQLVTASKDGSARTWDAVVQPRLSVVAELGAPVSRVAFAAGGRALTATAGTSMFRIRLPRGSAVRVGSAAAPPEEVTGPDGLRAAIAGDVVSITRGDGSTIELTGHHDTVTSVAFSADGKSIVTASKDHDARIWDTASGALRHVLLGHFAIVSDARFSPDGRWVVTAGPRTAGLWSTRSGRLISFLGGNTDKVLSVAFAPDGRRIATGGADGTVQLYRCVICGDPSELIAIADARLRATGRVLTAEERRLYD